MRKTYLYIGIALVAAAFVTLLVSGSAINIKSVLSQANYTVDGGTFSYLSLPLANQSAMLLVGRFSAPVDFYLFNGSAFSSWSAAENSANSLPGYQEAQSLEGSGLFFYYHNVTSVIVPYQPGTYNVSPVYSLNVSKGFPGGTYYAVIDNNVGLKPAPAQSINATLLYATQSPGSAGSSLSKFVLEEAAIGLVFFMLLIAGIIMVIIGFIKKPKGLQQQGTPQMNGAQPLPKGKISDEQLDDLYKKIKKKSKQSK